jgi:hypothetical protein
MPVVFEPEYEALWHMFAEDSTTVAEKNRALLVGGAFFYQVIVPAVTNPTTKDFLMRGSPGQRARWLGGMCHAMGYRSDTAAADFDAAKDIANMPRMDYSIHPSNWRNPPFILFLFFYKPTLYVIAPHGDEQRVWSYLSSRPQPTQ